MRQLLLVVGAALITASPIVLQAQDTTKPAPAASTTVTKLVTGRVTNEKGAPLEDVTVQVKGSRTSTKTNSSGSYNLSVPENGVLVFSFVGMAKEEISVAGKTGVDLQMKPSIESNLDEVIVVGYGTQKAKNVTGSIVSLDLKKIEDMPVTTIAEALKGQVPGLSVSGGSTRPGVNPTISIRQQFGFSKDGASPLPLIIIDDVIQLDPNTGLPSMDQFNLLDLSEVESVTVLRDASAAIYGSRASQGAIVVKTKRGKNAPPKISYAGKFETNDAVGHIKTMNAYDHGVFSNRYGRAAGWVASSFFSDTELEQMKSLDYDWRKEAWSSATSAQHSVNVNGGTDRATYFAGASYLTQGANMGAQDYDKWTFRTGTDVKVVNNLKLSATVAANNFSVLKSFTKVAVGGGYGSGGEQNDYALLNHIPKYIPWIYNVNGKDEYISPALGANRVQTTPVGQNTMAGWNYFALQNNGSNTNSKNFSYNTNFSLQYDVPFIRGLSMKATYALTNSTENTEQVALPQRLAVNLNTAKTGTHLYSPGTAADWFIGVNRQGSRVTYSDIIGKQEQTNFYINYDRSFGPHSISAIGSVERGKQEYNRKFLIYENPLDGAYNGSSSSAGTLNTGTTEVKRTQGGNLSYLGRVSYNYNSKYLLQFVFRTDASTKFAPENYWGFFPSMSAGWVISSEDWFKNNVRWVNNLKIRASIGKTGNDNLAAWRWLQTYTYTADKGIQFGSNGGVLGNSLNADATPYRNVRWDRSIKQNAGIDFAVLNNRLSGSIDGYYDRIRDMLTQMSAQTGVPISVGGAFAEQNYAGVNTWGTEISLNWKDKIGDVSYSIGMNYGWGNNKVVKYFPVAFDYPSKNTRQEGSSSINPGWGFITWKGTSTGDGLLRTDADIDAYWQYLTDLATKAGTAPSYFNNTDKTAVKKGMLAYEDQAGALDANAKTIGGRNGRISKDEDYAQLVKKNITQSINTNLNVSWKGISLAAQIATSWGGLNQIDYINQPTGSTQLFFYSHESYLKDMYDPLDNVNGKYPSLAFYDQNGASSDFWQISSFRCFIRSMSVGYSLPKKWVNVAHIESTRLFLAGYNLWDFANPYPDKYRTMYDSPTVGYPTLRTWALGVNVGF
jgi:TonB-linked SusC/RagA family outer membrane protein